MELTVIPGLATERAATLWFGVTARQPPGGLRLHVADALHVLPASAWTPLRVGTRLDSRNSAAPFWFFRHRLEALAPDTVYRVQAEFADGSGGRATQAVLRTMPASLPLNGSGESLRVDLRSCFYLKNGRASASQPRADISAPPHLKVLCGDQVYLDLPVLEWPRGEQGRFLSWLDKYRENWSQLGGTFASVLGRGANLFVSDDHEFWNNYPYGAIYKPASWGSGSQDASTKIARALYQAFQADYETSQSGVQGLDIGPPGAPELSLRALDCRYFRSRERFAPDKDVRAICEWIGGLRCPGVLVLSQPLLDPAGNAFARRVKDAALADFPASFEPLLAGIRESRHDLMILSGDIHCGRVSSVALPRGRILWEVVSSPVALCAGRHSGAEPVRMLPGMAGGIVHHPTPNRVTCVERDHHALLDFTRTGATVTVKLRFEALGVARLDQPLPILKDIELS